jgi:hypothetical protein
VPRLPAAHVSFLPSGYWGSFPMGKEASM